MSRNQELLQGTEEHHLGNIFLERNLDQTLQKIDDGRQCEDLAVSQIGQEENLNSCLKKVGCMLAYHIESWLKALF